MLTALQGPWNNLLANVALKLATVLLAAARDDAVADVIAACAAGATAGGAMGGTLGASSGAPAAGAPASGDDTAGAPPMGALPGRLQGVLHLWPWTDRILWEVCGPGQAEPRYYPLPRQA